MMLLSQQYEIGSTDSMVSHQYWALIQYKDVILPV